MPKTLIVILGPTGIGKTSLALQIANYYSTEIISCDSRQIYREMRIGTAVPDQATLSQVKHHFIQSHSIHDYYNASKFEVEVLQTLEMLFEKHEAVVMVGGSMMYIDAVCKGIDDLPEVDPEIRQSLIERMNKEGIESLRMDLRYLDPVYYAEADLRNPKRIMHALEICLMTGKPYSSFRTRTIKKRDFDILKIGLNTERSILYERIDQRVEEMFREGLVEEAHKLYPLRHLNSLNTVGYKELFDYFEEKTSLEEAKEKIKTNSHKYARKQLTWFSGDSSINWFSPGMESEILKFLDEHLHLQDLRNI
ncbi:MAG: tRNA (adenosine(37)-N6)-dimethylallyltransferase MiaA [Bacteroidota bacterium]|nr:tRNA (adenosine(37)-N6)-dimethylallyltransferase MiaA [Bacteroidota bacterium]